MPSTFAPVPDPGTRMLVTSPPADGARSSCGPLLSATTQATLAPSPLNAATAAEPGSSWAAPLRRSTTCPAGASAPGLGEAEAPAVGAGDADAAGDPEGAGDAAGVGGPRYA